MSNYVYFNNEYFFTKDQFTNKLNEKLADSDSLSEQGKEELYDLYRSGVFERFGLQKDDEKDRDGALAEISKFFETNSVISSNIEEYLCIESINVPLIEFDPIIEINGNSYTVPQLRLESIQEGIDFQFYLFSFNYNVVKTANQRVSPILSFSENGNETRRYETLTDIDLTNRHDGTVEFTIPLTNILENNAGVYTLSCNSSVLCRVTVPKVTLPLGQNGVKDFQQLRGFLETLEGKPTSDLRNLYFLLRNRHLEYWINNTTVKEKLRKQMNSWESDGHTMTINDIDSLFSPVFGVNNALCFIVSDFVSVDIKEISSEGIIHIGKNCNHYVKRGTDSEGSIIMQIRPRNGGQWNLDFNLRFRVDTSSLKGKISFNLNELGNDKKTFPFSCSEFSNKHLGTYKLFMMSNTGTIGTGCSFCITGEVINIPLTDRVSLPMVGIRHDGGNLYVAQNPITHRQMRCIIKEGIRDYRNCLQEVLNSSINAHEGDHYPTTFLSYDDCQKIVNILNARFPKYQFKIPSFFELYSALNNGFDGNEINLGNTDPRDNILPVRHGHVTDLGVYDLLNNVYLHTSDVETHVLSQNERTVFGSPYYERTNWPLIHRPYTDEQGRNLLPFFGFTPVMTKR